MNRWKIPAWLEQEVLARDAHCVYCGVAFSVPALTHGVRASWEHIVNDASIVTLQNIVRCCMSCNASKGTQDLRAWLSSAYCRRKGITENTVAEVVRSALASDAFKVHSSPHLWMFDEIAASDPQRAARLQAAPSAKSLADSILTAFAQAIEADNVRIGMEEAGDNPNDLRVTLQFHIGETLSDQFFNAMTGYRGEFRRGWQYGLRYNRSVIEGVRAIVAECSKAKFAARRLNSKFEDTGAMEVTREQMVAGLVPHLSKVWFCGRLIEGDGRVSQLATGVVGPKLRLTDNTTSWPAIWRADPDAWLDIKGAFVGSGGPYQLKDPVDRAKKLEASGEA